MSQVNPEDANQNGRTAARARAQAARELFDRWAEEEAGGYAGEVSWEEFKRSLDDERRRSGARLLFPEG